MTGELYQPGRIYYDIFNLKTVIGAFNKLRCVDFNPKANQGIWIYEQEAKRLKFEKSYNAVPKDARPVILGYITIEDDTMWIDVRSFDRVVRAIDFFDRRINRRAAQVSKLRIANKVFTVKQGLANPETQLPSFEDLFDREDITPPRSDEMLAEMEKINAEHEDPESRQAAALEWMESFVKQPTPEVEELQPNFYEDGIESLQWLLRMRQIEAIERWKGNENFSQFDVLGKLFESAEEEDAEESSTAPEEE